MAQLGSGVAQLGCGVAQLGCAVAQSGCGVAHLGCGVARLGCGVAQLGCGVAQFRVRRGSVGSAWACCKAGPSSILSSAPHGGFSLAERRSDEDTRRKPWRMVKDE